MESKQENDTIQQFIQMAIKRRENIELAANKEKQKCYEFARRLFETAIQFIVAEKREFAIISHYNRVKDGANDRQTETVFGVFYPHSAGARNIDLYGRRTDAKMVDGRSCRNHV